METARLLALTGACSDEAKPGRLLHARAASAPPARPPNLTAKENPGASTGQAAYGLSGEWSDVLGGALDLLPEHGHVVHRQVGAARVGRVGPPR